VEHERQRKEFRNILTKSRIIVVFSLGVDVAVVIAIPSGLLVGTSGAFGPNGAAKSGS